MDFAAGILILLLACIGNTELWIVLINRRHSLRYRHYQLRRLRTFHDVGIVLFPPFIFYTAGFGPQGLLNGGELRELPLIIQGILFVALLGLLPLSFSMVRWALRRTPAQLTAVSSRTIDTFADAADDLQRDAVVGQPGLLAKLPGNQIYQLEISQKTLRIPGTVTTDKPLRIAHFTDTHFLHCPGRGYHERVIDELCAMKPDLFVFTGDLLDCNTRVEWANDMFTRLKNVAPGYFILGNHDWHLDYKAAREVLVNVGWIDVGEKYVEATHAGQRVLIAGTESPWIGGNPEVPMSKNGQFRLLLSHAPDQRNYAEENQFDLMLCGHNHGGQVVLPVVGPVYSPSCYGVRYAGGVFRYKKLLMHVSRGVSAKDTLRLNCRPEISLLSISEK